MNTFEKVCRIISDQLSMSSDIEFSEDTTWEEINADSLDLVEIVMAIEDEFGIAVPDEAVSEMRNMGDLVAFIQSVTEEK